MLIFNHFFGRLRKSEVPEPTPIKWVGFGSMQKRARRTQDTEIVILCTKKLVINLNRFGHIYLYKFLKLNGNRD